ncbi:hypothetical protein BU24DRAFT_188603 [Aaosphaeria arxii CBS 175.79]|uniref:Uncharacterized protein n=1 Tax=Aaosphaeria arxii CBS 175.79 TaxID=1450172 RepID=A0A6A5XSM6_9PLEO|nr:uncharacterized protein BU24DRAFT_188603 [Aaosphaeria arxii CBS 175.79]KAF2015943.1 hypothetical protein BU24DRAFT_188603 [Aaosphaeria arxii CBS 175.79]
MWITFGLPYILLTIIIFVSRDVYASVDLDHHAIALRNLGLDSTSSPNTSTPTCQPKFEVSIVTSTVLVTASIEPYCQPNQTEPGISNIDSTSAVIPDVASSRSENCTHKDYTENILSPVVHTTNPELPVTGCEICYHDSAQIATILKSPEPTAPCETSTTTNYTSKLSSSVYSTGPIETMPAEENSSPRHTVCSGLGFGVIGFIVWLTVNL